MLRRSTSLASVHRELPQNHLASASCYRMSTHRHPVPLTRRSFWYCGTLAGRVKPTCGDGCHGSFTSCRKSHHLTSQGTMSMAACPFKTRRPATVNCSCRRPASACRCGSRAPPLSERGVTPVGCEIELRRYSDLCPRESLSALSYPVAIVGAGPAGLTLSALLSQFDVPSVLLEKASGLPTHPQAHFINLRSMEVLRHAFGGLDMDVLDACPPREEWRDFVVCSTALGRELARVDNFSGGHTGETRRRKLSPTSVAHLSQNVLLPVLLQEARRTAAAFCPSSQGWTATVSIAAHQHTTRKMLPVSRDLLQGTSPQRDRLASLNNGAVLAVIIFDAEVQDLCRTPPTARGQNTHTLDLLLRPSQRYNRTTITDGEARDTVHHLSDFSSNKFPDISGAPRPTVVTCNYVVAADGAGSTVRTAAGIGLSGQKGLGYLVNIHFRCVGLGRLLRDTGRRAGMLYFVYNEEVICVLVAHNVQKGEWACQLPFFPPHQSSEDFTPERALMLVRHALGPGADALDVEIRSVRPWTMNALVAEAYSKNILAVESCSKSAGRVDAKDGDAATAEEGRGGPGMKAEGSVFVVGDAAHQFPPAGGFGLNTGVQDAHNLAWKLAAVHHGLAPPELFSTYQQERRPVATRNAALSVRNLRRSLRVMESLGVNPDLGASSNVMDQLVRSPLALTVDAGVSGLTSSLLQPQKRSEKILRLGRSQLECLRRPGHPYGDWRVRELHKLLQEGGGLPLLFPVHDVGFSYRKGAFSFSDGEPKAGGHGSVSQNKKLAPGAVNVTRDATVPYSAKIQVGMRMPHFTLRPPRRDGSITRDLPSDETGRGGNDNRGGGASASASPPRPPQLLSTVDLPDQIRGVLRRSRQHGRASGDSGDPSSTTAADSRYGLDVSGVRTGTERVLPGANDGEVESSRVSLLSVLIVAALPGGDGGNGDSASREVTAAQSKWASIMKSALQDRCEHGKTPPLVSPLPHVMTLMVIPPLCEPLCETVAGEQTTAAGATDVDALHGKHASPADERRGVAGDEEEDSVSRFDQWDKETRSGGHEAPPGHWTLGYAMTRMEHLDPYLDDRFCLTTATSTPRSRPAPGLEFAGDATIVARNTFSGVSSAAVGSSPDQWAGYEMPLAMLAVDDDARSLGNAFAAEGIEAVLLRPDGHVSWVARVGSGSRDTIASVEDSVTSSAGGDREGKDGELVMAFRQALEATFVIGGDRGGDDIARL